MFHIIYVSDSMVKITLHSGEKRELLKKFESEQWPIADKEHYGDDAEYGKAKYTLIAYEKEKVVGNIYMSTEMGVATIDSLLVHNEFQRLGIATELLQQAELKAKEDSCHVVRIETGKAWKARIFYEKQGYETIATFFNYYNNEDFIVLEKRISSVA